MSLRSLKPAGFSNLSVALFFLGIIILSVLFYRVRVLSLDGAYQTFWVIQKHWYIPHEERFGVLNLSLPAERQDGGIRHNRQEELSNEPYRMLSKRKKKI